ERDVLDDADLPPRYVAAERVERATRFLLVVPHLLPHELPAVAAHDVVGRRTRAASGRSRVRDLRPIAADPAVAAVAGLERGHPVLSYQSRSTPCTRGAGLAWDSMKESSLYAGTSRWAVLDSNQRPWD